MYGIGISELALILLVLLLFFKPEDIFAFIRKTGQFYSRLSRLQNEMEDIIKTDFDNTEKDDSFGFDMDHKNNNEINDSKGE